MRIQRSKWACLSAVAATLLVGALTLRAQPPPNDTHALNAIFRDEFLASNVLDVCSQAASLSAEARYTSLSGWVLPGAHHPGFRVVADFSPTDPAPNSADPEHASGFRVPAGGEIISPALDLIDTAAALDRLDELRRRIEATTATSAADRVDQLALLALVDMRRDDVPSAQTNLGELFELALPEGGEVRQLDPVLLCVHAAADHPRLSLAIVDAAYRVVQSYQQVYVRSAWQRQYTAAYARVEQAARDVDEDAEGRSVTIPLSLWTPASPPRAQFRGSGCPIAQWVTAAGRADNLSSHDQDFLYFASPLRGNYEVECDVAGFGWHDTQLLVAGKWVGPVYDLKSYSVAGVDGYISRIQFAPPLTKVGEYIHDRTVVREGMATTYFNGRPIHTQPLPPDHDPWLAVRSEARMDGGVRNLWITGDPVVPEELRLARSPDLTHWVPYYEEIVGIDWRYANPEADLYAPRRSRLHRGAGQESALFYHRPMLEDGSIEYEFRYDPAECEAHPVLDRLCFILDPAGVKVHWLTDGSFERTGLAPDNLHQEPDNRRGSGPLPLHAGDWNHLRLTVRGDTVDLLLNKELVYQRKIEATNQRHFGLFHYADETELRVRNIVWKGDWPREIPGVDEQELVSHETDFLDDRVPELTAVFEHDFAAGGLPLDRFAIVRGDSAADVVPQPDGLHLTRKAAGGYRNSTVAPKLTVSGDFDITASFEQLVSEPPVAGGCNVYLLALADSETADECMLVRRHTLLQGSDDQVIQCARVWRPDGQERRHYFARQPVEARGGTLRLARRGERVYYLFAENDSRQFRMIGEESFPADDLQLEGVRLIAQINGESGITSVVMKNLTVRAESLAGPAVIPDDNSLEEINRERDSLPQSVFQDFTTAAPDEAIIRRWTDLRQWNPADNGLLIVAPGTDNWTSAGAVLQRRIEGDFDIGIRFDPKRLDTPAAGLNSSVYLQVELADAGATQLSLIFQKLDSDVTEVFVQLSTDDGGPGRNYRRLGRIAASSVEGLRIARRGRQITCIARSKKLGGEIIVGQGDVGDAPLDFDSARIMVHTGGAGRESHVVWKSFDVHAERIIE